MEHCTKQPCHKVHVSISRVVVCALFRLRSHVIELSELNSELPFLEFVAWKDVECGNFYQNGRGHQLATNLAHRD